VTSKTDYKPGDIILEELKLKSARGWELDLITGKSDKTGNEKLATYVDFNVYESMFQPFTTMDLDIFDSGDAMGKLKINGDETISLKYSVPGVEEKFVIELASKEISTISDLGALKSKGYQIKAISQEMLNAQSNYVNKSWQSELTSKIVEDVVKNNFKSKKKFDNPTPTEGKMKTSSNNEHPVVFLDRLKEKHVAPKESNTQTYFLFEQRDPKGEEWKFVFDTFDSLAKKDPVSGLTYTIDAAIVAEKIYERDEYMKALYVQLPKTAETSSKWGGKVRKVTYNTSTGELIGGKAEGVVKYDPKQFDTKLGKHKPSSDKQEDAINETENPPPIFTTIDPTNNPDELNIPDAKVARQQFATRLNNDIGMMEVIAYPKLRLGDVIHVKFPVSKADAGPSDEGEEMIDDYVMIVTLRHKIKPETTYPRATYVIGFVKSGYAKSVEDVGQT
jgi:hypothetical protein